MTLHKSDGLVLKRDRLGESSLLVELLLKDGGKTNLVAKGARRPESVLVGKLEPFSEVQVLYYRQADENLGVISQVEELRSNHKLSADLLRLSSASAVVEAIENMIIPPEEAGRFFDLAVRTLYFMNYAQPKKLEPLFLFFLLKALVLLGFAPRLETADGNKAEEAEILFSVEEGGVIARGNADPNGKYLRLDRGMLTILQTARQTEIEKLKNLVLTKKQAEVLKDLLLAFLSFHTGGKAAFNSLDLLSKLPKI